MSKESGVFFSWPGASHWGLKVCGAGEQERFRGKLWYRKKVLGKTYRFGKIPPFTIFEVILPYRGKNVRSYFPLQWEFRGGTEEKAGCCREGNALSRTKCRSCLLELEKT